MSSLIPLLYYVMDSFVYFNINSTSFMDSFSINLLNFRENVIISYYFTFTLFYNSFNLYLITQVKSFNFIY
jgi:hypothetical protein